jgi:inosine triphosphate pyrophosphatase
VLGAVLLAHSQEAKVILGAGFPFEVESCDVDLPELQGEPDEVAREKCVLAAKAVRANIAPGVKLNCASVIADRCCSDWTSGFVSLQVGGPVMVEDVSLGFDAMGGLPGVYIKWFLNKLGHDGLNKMLAGFSDKSAKAVCTYAFCSGPGRPVKLFPGIVPVSFECASSSTAGAVHAPTPFGWRWSRSLLPRAQGTIVEARGPADFGWDAIFQPAGFEQT